MMMTMTMMMSMTMAMTPNMPSCQPPGGQQQQQQQQQPPGGGGEKWGGRMSLCEDGPAGIFVFFFSFVHCDFFCKSKKNVTDLSAPECRSRQWGEAICGLFDPERGHCLTSAHLYIYEDHCADLYIYDDHNVLSLTCTEIFIYDESSLMIVMF